MNVAIKVLSGIKGWFCHIGSVVFRSSHVTRIENQLNVEHQIVLLLAGDVEAHPLLTDELRWALKAVIQRQALRAGVEDELHRIVKQEVEPAAREQKVKDRALDKVLESCRKSSGKNS